MSGLPSPSKSHEHKSKISSGFENVLLSKSVVKGCTQLKLRTNFFDDRAESLVFRFITSTLLTRAPAGTRTAIAVSVDVRIVPLTDPNQTCNCAALALNPEPLMRTVEKG
jgi:hypothetical protein